ncbi:nuclear transport factor 2 family protein [Novosphingobium sp.]|uniref:nuclear transport factor 2 family protein n=1 Tax=Novosphingobium sp. TaxID=1874826 RepID=UPI0025D6B6A6|nr:nuclear transport factor 2 family protein [Novosphingobium sp.]MCC6924831.1 nuclear transport factor 2 family protein [Novosphingobium sp.]
MLSAIALLAAAPVALPEGAALREEVRAADDRFFSLFFDTRCHSTEVRAMLADDVEMYHDKGGVVATSAAQFMADYEKVCASRAAPDAWRSRRELVPASLTVDPVPGLGAIEDGEHRFYERRGDGPERLAGTAQFTQLWVKSEAGWKLKRIFSFAHRAAS